MFKSRPVIRQDLGALLDSYYGFARSHAAAVLNHPNRVPARAIDLRSLRSSLDGFVARATSLIADPDFSTLTADEQDDAQKIATEAAIAIEELDDLTDPSALFNAMAHSKRVEAVDHETVAEIDTAHLFARIKGEKRGQAKRPKG